MKEIKSFAIEKDKYYGVDRRSGWTVKVNGSVVVQFEKHLTTALLKTAYTLLFIWDRHHW